MKVWSLLLLPIVGCAGQSQPVAANSGTPEHEIVLEVGQRAVLSGDIQVEFVRVVADSRCPSNVTCVWAGDAAVEIRMAERDSVSASVLHTNGQSGAGLLTWRHLRVELAAVDPHPVEGTSTGPYRARLRWSFLPD